MKTEDDRGRLPPPSVRPHPSRDARVNELVVGGQTLLVISCPVGEPAFQKLSDAEEEVARLAILGFSNAEIAAKRATSTRTIANQMASILRKLDLGSRRELAAEALRRAARSNTTRGHERASGRRKAGPSATMNSRRKVR